MTAPLDIACILERAGADADAPEGSQAWALAQVAEAIEGLVVAAIETADLLDDETAYRLRVALAGIRDFA